MKKIIAAGAVMVKNRKLLVVNDGKDDFYKIPGGKPLDGESLEDCVHRELKEETGFECKIINKLSTKHLNKKPGTGEEIEIFLYHFKSEIIGEINNFDSFENEGHEVKWLEIENIEKEKVAPNILFLKEKSEL